MAKLLFADDDDALSATVSEWCKLENHLVDMVSDGQAALEHLKAFEYDILILDWAMPVITGLEVCEQYRASGGNAPILILTAKSHIDEKTMGFDAGADDYLTKPFHFKELKARLGALLRRPSQIVANTLTVRDVVLDSRVKKVIRGGKEVVLRPLEYAVLEFFMKHPRQFFTPEILMHRIWGSDADVSDNAIYACITRIRKKLEFDDENPLIISKYGFGYKLEP